MRCDANFETPKVSRTSSTDFCSRQARCAASPGHQASAFHSPSAIKWVFFFLRYCRKLPSPMGLGLKPRYRIKNNGCIRNSMLSMGPLSGLLCFPPAAWTPLLHTGAPTAGAPLVCVNVRRDPFRGPCGHYRNDGSITRCPLKGDAARDQTHRLMPILSDPECAICHGCLCQR